GATPASFEDSLVILHREVLALLPLEQLVHIGNHGRDFADDKNVSAEIEYFFGDIRVDPVHERDNRDDSSNPDNYTQQRQDRTKLVSPERLQSDSNGFDGIHVDTLAPT